MTQTLMAQEIAEIPSSVAACLNQNAESLSVIAERLRQFDPQLVITVARGSSDHAASPMKICISGSFGSHNTKRIPYEKWFLVHMSSSRSQRRQRNQVKNASLLHVIIDFMRMWQIFFDFFSNPAVEFSRQMVFFWFYISQREATRNRSPVRHASFRLKQGGLQ